MTVERGGNTSGGIFDVVVIGGGINGAGMAADAAGRGLSVLLAEADDLAGATSQASSKLVHGGLRYLEHFAFRLVREALAEREILLAKAPHIIWPLRFVLPHVAGMRPAWMLRAGLFLYDHLASRRTLPASRWLDLSRDPVGRALKAEYANGFSYWDCWVDDARLVILNAMAAREAGAEIVTRTPVTGLNRDGGLWRISLGGGKPRQVAARAVVNAAGPWAGDVARLLPSSGHGPPRIRLVKGSHIVVPRIAGADDACIFQSRDGRVVFALPFERAFTLIGTTDEPFDGDARTVTPSPAEEDYLLDLANRFFRAPLSRADIVWRFAGVRPLEDDGSANPSAVSRDYRLLLDETDGAPALHVIGGKITTYRRLAETGVDMLAARLWPDRIARPARAVLPGGDVGAAGFDSWLADLVRRHPGFESEMLRRLARRHGTRVAAILEGATDARDLGQDFGGGLTAREVDYLKHDEWAMTADDVLWRRTKCGLHIPPERRAAVTEAVQACLDAS